MSKYLKEIKEKVISLFEKELSPFRIAKELEIPEHGLQDKKWG